MHYSAQQEPLVQDQLLFMGKGKSTATRVAIQEDFITPFYVIKDYRKSLKLKKQRELRKKRIQHQKEILRDAEREEKSTIIQQINRSMLDQDDVWSKVQDDLKFESEQAGDSTGHQDFMEKKIQRLRWEVLFTLGHVEKQPIFCDVFAGFDFQQE